MPGKDELLDFQNTNLKKNLWKKKKNNSDIYKHHKQQGQVDCGGFHVIFSGCFVDYSITLWQLQEWEVMQERKG